MTAETGVRPERSAGSEADGPDIRLTNLRKTYGDVVAVDRIDIEIQPGEFFTMLGPSGSGKTTTLRLIAGFERPDFGSSTSFARGRTCP